MKKEQRYIEVINQNRGMIYNLSSVYTNSREDREDLIQEIYFQTWKSFDSFDEKSKISTWLYRIAMNTSIQYLKKKSRRIKSEYLKKRHIYVQENSHNIESEAIHNMLLSIKRLNELDKGIILLYLDEKSHKEIAEIIGLSVSNVGTRIQRIKTKLNKLNKS